MKLYKISAVYITGTQVLFVWADYLIQALNKIQRPLYVQSFEVIAEVVK